MKKISIEVVNEKSSNPMGNWEKKLMLYNQSLENVKYQAKFRK